MENRRLKPYHGLLLMGAVLVALVFIATPLQLNFGIAGLALTELMLLVLTAAAFLLIRPNFASTFPMRLPPVREFFGGAFLYAGTYLIMIGPLLLTQYFFPEVGKTADALTGLGTSVSPAMAVFVIAVLPAICEETLHRGFILASLRSIKSTVAIVLISGLLFGVFHLDPFRFLPTMMLGCAFAYIALKTESMVLTMIFHFINNLLSVISMFAAKPYTDSYTEVYAELKLGSVIGVGMVYLAIGAVLIFIGYCLLNRRSPKQKTIAAVVLTAVVLIIAGIVTVASSSITKVLDMSGTFEVNPETGSVEFPLDLDSDGYYTVSVSAICSSADIIFTLERVAGDVSGELSEEIAAADAAFVPMSATTAAETAEGAAAEVTEEKRAMPSVVLSQRGEGTLVVSQNLMLERGKYVMRLKLDPAREGVYPPVTAQMQILRLLG
ncbi:MAG: CPBP family intramembrane glutamic endopeptidase [Eubacteriales bacterium]|jgi:membrane protease YdiL (CAAX protease family)|nr:CPBP family intramembrane metalloprotease [Clostridiales bacterium]